MRLFLVELYRLRLRRAVVVLLAGCLVATIVVLVGTLWSTRPVSAEELRQAQEQVERDRNSRFFQRDLARCERNPARFGVDEASMCETMMGPQVDWYLSRSPLRLQAALRGPGLGVITVLMGLLMLVGTTFAGADWNSGSMSNQLLFEPRRLRVWAAKAAAVVAVAVVTSAALLGAFWGVTALVADAWEIKVPPDITGTILASSARAVLVIGAATLGAYAVTMLVRSTVFTLGAMFAVVVGATVVMALLGISEAWFPNKNLGAVIWDGTRYFVEPPPACFEGPRRPEGLDCRAFERLSLWTGVRNLGVLLAGAVALSLWSFRRRDVP